MEVLEIKLDLIKWLTELNDLNILKKLNDVRIRTEKGSHITIKPLTKEELIARALISEKSIAEGDVTDFEDLMKENW